MTPHVPERLYTSTLFSGPLAIKMSLLLSCCSYSSITSLSLMSVPNGYIIPMRNKFLRFLSFSNNERKKKQRERKPVRGRKHKIFKNDKFMYIPPDSFTFLC